MRATLKLHMWFVVLVLLLAAGASAQQTPPPPQFAFTGFIQEATLDTTGAICTPAPQSKTITNPDGTTTTINLDVTRLRGGTVTVNGIKIIVPCNSVVQLPANTMPWADLFDPASSTPVGPNVALSVAANPLVSGEKTGLALADRPGAFPAFDISITGNVVGKNADGTDRYIAAYITPIEQQVLNGGSGIISCIDYTNGSFRVGGTPAVASRGQCPANADGSLLQFNDPEGRWGRAVSIDPRFSGDNENTTINASTGIPACIPRTTDGATPDPLCPWTNRPLNGDPRFPTDPFIATGAPLKNFMMPAPVCAAGTGPGTTVLCQNTVTPDAYQQVPMMVGDQVVWTGTSYLIDPNKTRTLTLADGTVLTIQDTTAANTYISAHTVEDVLGIFTQPGIPPAYVAIEDFLIGSGGNPVQGLLQEASTRLTVVGFTTDPTRLVDIYANDINPCTGENSLRLLATTDPATQPLVGRFVLRVLGGLFMPPTRTYTVKTRTQFTDPTTGAALNPQPLVANGIESGHYLLPVFEYTIPENHKLGDPFIPGNFQDFPFLALGEGPIDGPGSDSAIVGQLDPWPGDTKPAPVNCANFGHVPVVNAGPDLAWGTNTSVKLTGTVTWDAKSDPTTRTVQWVRIDTGEVLPSTIATTGNISSVTANFTSPATAGTVTARLTATDGFGTGSDVVNNVIVPPSDIVQFVTALFAIQRGQRGNFGKLTVSATSSDPTAQLTLIETAIDGSTQNWGTGAFNKNTNTWDWQEIKGVLQPASLTLTSTKGGSATTSCGQPNAKGAVTCP